MIIIKLIGGLGNQMFQYALGRKLSRLKNIPFKLDISWYEKKEFGPDIKREYSLGHFKIAEDLALDSELKKFAYKKSFPYRMWRKFRREVLLLNDMDYNPRVLRASEGHLEGFWQSEKYFADIRDILLDDFTLKEGFGEPARQIESEIIGNDSVSLHVRRGDYVSDPRVAKLIGSCGPDYYKDAIRLIKEKIKEPRFFVFSDDISWARSNLEIGAPAVFVSRPEIRDYEELVLMSKCKNHITANSSFSWWGAWLDANPGKIIIAPRKWFNDTKINSADVIPESWIKI